MFYPWRWFFLLTAAFVLVAAAVDLPRGARVAAAGSREKKDAARPAVGEVVASIRFVDQRYLTRTIEEFGRKKAYVIVFTNLDCPIARRYLPKLKELDEQYRDKDVPFLSLNVGADDSVVDVAYQAVKADITFPFCKDFDGAAARALGVTRTPEAVVLDGDLRIRYRGRIDDRIRFGGVRPGAGRDDLKEALDDVLAGKKVRVPETPVDGCLITFPAESSPEQPVTFSEHVAPLLQKHCQKCHRPDTEAPFSLLSYDDARTHAQMIGEVVLQRRMPPWFASREHGEFINRQGMSERERETIADWIRGGVQEGDRAKLPKPLTFPKKKWQIGTPDLEIKMLQKERIPAQGYIPYRYAVLPHVFVKDTWVQKIEILPGNRSILHHCNLGYLSLGGSKADAQFITGFVPGGTAMILDRGTGFKIPAGSVLVLQLHYVSTGEAASDQTSVGFVFPKETIDKQIHHVQVTTRRFAIPPGAAHHPVTSRRTLAHDAAGIGMFVHMHLRGKDMTFRALYPDGTKETLLAVPNYSFDWQMSYRWENGTKRFPKGTQIECVAHYDNSAFNPYNPDPKKTVRHGPQTFHEMMYGFFFYLDENEKLGVSVDPNSGHETGRTGDAASARPAKSP